jgi:hypothetical protein
MRYGGGGLNAGLLADCLLPAAISKRPDADVVIGLSAAMRHVVRDHDRGVVLPLNPIALLEF